MTTALDLITDALFEIGAAEIGQALPSEDSTIGLRKLNQLLQRWSNKRFLFPVLTEFSVTLTGAASYTLGPSGDVVGLRPLKINAASCIAGGVEYPVTVRTRAEWDAIAVKDVTGGPVSEVWYEAANTNGRVYVYPKASGYTLKLDAQALLTSFADLTTSLDLPEGYESAIVLTLADDLASTYGKRTPDDVLRRGAGARRAIKALNYEPVLATQELAGSSSDYRIERGY